MRGVIVLLACVIATPAMAQQPDSISGATLQVSLDEAVRRALLVQPVMVQADGAIRNADAARLASVGNFLPNVTVGGSAALGSQSHYDPNSQRIIPPAWNYGTNLSLSVDLFTGLRRMWTMRSASANLDAAEAGRVTQRYQVTLTTKQAFYNAIANADLVRVAQAQLDRTKRQLDVSVQKLQAGSATRSDSLRSAVDYGNARIALLQAEANLSTAEANLGRQIGVDEPVRAIADSVLPPLPDTSTLRATAIETAPQVQQADAQARASRATVWSSRSQYIPTLSLSYGANRQDTIFNNFAVGNPTHSWRFSVSWNLFDRFSREQNQVRSAVDRDVSESQAADARRAVNAQLTQQLAALETAYAQIGIAAVNLAAATEDLRVQQERYRVGAGTILDVLTSQANLTQAETNQVQTRFNYLIARAQLEATVGHTL